VALGGLPVMTLLVGIAVWIKRRNS